MTPRLRLAARWGAAASLVAAIVVPLAAAGLPRSADGRLHLYRILSVATAWRHGDFWPRFSPELAYGYGYPLFNYYAPLLYDLGAGLYVLGLGLIPTLKVLAALITLAGAAGALTLAAAWYGPAAGLAAAAVYAWAPYLLFNLVTRGAFPEALALALLPWLWWSLERALARPTAGALARLAGLTAALFLAHNLSAPIFSGLLAVWLGGRVAADPDRRRLALAATLLAWGLGAGLAAFFWLPALLETGLVQVAQLTAPATLDFRHYFLTLAELIRPTFLFDPHLEPPTVPVTFGLVPAGLSVAAVLIAGRRGDRLARGRVWALAALGAGLICLTLDFSRPIWETLAFLRFLQFPWRLLGPASLVAALLAGALVGALDGPAAGRARGLALLGLVAAAAGLALPWTFVTRYPAEQLPAAPTLADLYAYEVESGALGLTSTGEFLPTAVRQRPPLAQLQPTLADTGRVDRLETAGLPAGVRVLASASDWLSAEAAFETPQPFPAVFRWLYFPGWQAELDGQPARPYAAGPSGLLAVDVPAGSHRVRVVFDGSTPLRQGAAAVSLLAGLGLAGWLVRTWRRPALAPAPAVPAALRLWAAGGVLGLGLLFVRVWADSCGHLFCRSRLEGATVAGALQAAAVDFGGQLNLIGLDPPGPAAADEPLVFTLYWRLSAPATADYSIAVQLWDSAGHLVGQQDTWQPGGQPTHRWLPDGYAADAHALTPFPGTPPGVYRLMVGVYPAGGENLEVHADDGRPLGRFYEAGAVTVLAPVRPPAEAELSPQRALNTTLGPLRVLGVDGLGGAVTSGDALPLVLYWRAAADVPAGARLTLELAGASGPSSLLDGFEVPAVSVVRLPRTLLLPPTVPAGPAELRLSLDAGGRRVAGPVTLGAVTVNVPARVFDLPGGSAARLQARLGAGIELYGFALPGGPARAGAELTVVLYWRSLAVVATRYTVFVHVLDAAGRIVAQADAPPAQGARPTTGWLPPEVITDRYTLGLPADLAPGVYTLTAGLYDPASGARLPVAEAAGGPPGDRVLLTTVTLAGP